VDAVVVVKNADGHTTVRETVDPQPLPTALSGAVWAGLLGLILGGPVGWVAGMAIGAGAGAATAKVVDLGIPDDWVTWFREAVQPNTATVALLLTELHEGPLVEEAKRFAGGHLVYANVEPGTMRRLQEALGEASTPISTTSGDDAAERPGGFGEPPAGAAADVTSGAPTGAETDAPVGDRPDDGVANTLRP
ncbi:MAG: hypothetical protein JWM12_2225, partial [Ilumatobacteraceae bacterium]|nr:hypothetical protein [Ilumatobacteraceae bacterium]